MNWASGLDDKGRPKANKEARYDQSGKPAAVVPGPGGAHSWQPMSYSPLTKLVYFPVMEAGFMFIPANSVKPSKIGWNTGVDFNAGSLPTDPKVLAGIKQQLKGHLVAWDPVAQKEVWRVQFDHPWNGGTLATAGDLVFQGNSMGEFTAYRASDGKKLWSAPTQAGVLAAPISFEISGEQYVAVEVGWGRCVWPGRGRAGARCAPGVEHPAHAGLQAGWGGEVAGSARGRAGEARSAARDRQRSHVDRGKGRISYVLQRVPRRLRGQAVE